jgi:hypothetical protein
MLKVEADAVKVSWVEAAGATLIGKDEAVAAGGVVPAGSCMGIACDIDFDPADDAKVTAFRDLIATADVIIDETYKYKTTPYDASDFEEQFGVAPIAETYREDGLVKAIGGGSDWFETGKSSPQIILEELSSIVGTRSEDTTRYYLRRLDETPKIKTAAECDKEMPACGGTVAAIEAPCETYLTCVKITPASSSVAAALLLAAAAFA